MVIRESKLRCLILSLSSSPRKRSCATSRTTQAPSPFATPSLRAPPHLTPAARATTALQIGPPRRAAAQSCAIMWRASPAAASCSLPDYGVHPHRRQTTRTIVGPAPSAPTRLYFLVYLPLFALTQRSVESLPPSDPPPTQPPSDRRQFVAAWAAFRHQLHCRQLRAADRQRHRRIGPVRQRA